MKIPLLRNLDRYNYILLAFISYGILKFLAENMPCRRDFKLYKPIINSSFPLFTPAFMHKHIKLSLCDDFKLINVFEKLTFMPCDYCSY